MNDLAVGAPLAPQLTCREAHRVRRLEHATVAVRFDVGHVVRTVEPHDHAPLALHVPRRTGVTGWMPLAYTDTVADGEAGDGSIRLRRRRDRPAVRARQREPTAGSAVELLGVDTSPASTMSVEMPVNQCS